MWLENVYRKNAVHQTCGQIYKNMDLDIFYNLWKVLTML